jgi:putative SOS response-associated peptidase YedK
MCGRFVLLTDLSVLLSHFEVEESTLAVLPAGDLLPGQAVPAVIQAGQNRRLGALRWGLIPAWAKDPAVGRQMFNARAETLAAKPSFREAFRNRRCLIPADGFYDWTGEKGKRQAVRFGLRSGEPFAFAGLYETWRPPSGEAVHTCTIVTTEANVLVAPVHDRMPVILTRAGEALWLDPTVRDPAALQPLLQPYPADQMVMEAASLLFS